MKKCLPFALLVLFISFSFNSLSQVTPVWASAIRAGGTGIEAASSVDFDSQGNMYVCGNYNSPTITFGTFTLINNGLTDFFFVKYDASGNVVWAKSEGTQFGNEGAKIKVDGAGNIILAGATSSNNGITIGPLTMGADGCFIIKYDTNGNILWATGSHGGNVSNTCSIADIEFDPSGNIIIGGNFYTSTMYFDDLNNYITPLDDYNTFICKFNSSGIMLWGRPTSANSFAALTVDNAGNINMSVGNNTGVYFNNSSTLIFGAFSNTYDIFLARYDANGSMLWAKSEGGAGSDYIYDIIADNTQNFYITGWFYSDSVKFGNYTVVKPASMFDAMYVVKYNSNGVAQWARTATGSGNAESYLLRKDAQNNFYCAGFISGTSLNIGGIVLSTPPANGSDLFIAKFDTNGNFKWVTSNGGTGPDQINDVKPDGPDGYVYAAGEFRSPTITFGTSTLTKIGVADVFVAKLDQIPTPVVLNVSNKCVSDPNAYGKLLNPPANTYTVGITMDGNPLAYQAVDSSFQYFNSGVTALGSHNIAVKYTRANVSAQTDTSFTVSSSAPASVTINASGNNICAGSSVIFTATPTNGGSAPTYQWQVNGINAGTNSNTFTTSALNNNDQVKVVLTSSLSCASPANATSNIITMSVSPAPTANAGNDVTICSGASTQLQGSGGSTYSWSPAAGLSNPNIANPVATPSITTAYILTVSNGGSCNAKDTVVVTVAPSVTSSVNITASGNNICSGTSVMFTATPVNGGTAPAYQWQVNGVNAGTNSNTFTTSALTNNAQVKVILTSSLNCVSPATATSNIITMSVTPSPIADAGSDVSICAGGSIQLQASGGITYSWSPAVGLSNATIANPVASPAATTFYAVTVSNGSCSSTDTVVVTVNGSAAPTVNISTPNTNICFGTAATFTATPLNGGTNPSYQWQVNATNTGTNSNTFTSNTLTHNSQVKVLLTSNSNCVTTPNAVSNVITMNVDQLAAPLITENNRTFTVTNPDAAAAYTWQIKTNNVWYNVVPTATGITYTAPAAGEYRVKAVKGTCILFSASSVANIVSPLSHFIYVHPNPASHFVTFDSINLYKKYQTLEIVDMHGRRVMPFINVKNQAAITLDISLLAKGMYMAIFRQWDDTYSLVRFIKQ